MSSAPERVTACLYCELGVSALDGEPCARCEGVGTVEVSIEACTECSYTSPCRCELVAYNAWREENGLAIEQGLSGE
jgi:hypothetical protein